jgi:hypothetical protein
MRAAWLILCLAACSSAVSSGLPPLVTGCHTASDCSSAGPEFQCIDGGCMILACSCDSDCAAAGLLCYEHYLCLAVDAGSPCG